ncbi:GumC family protein [Daejeonella oryzae]|uniref:GumC family protein n=1 Tax=Daejeonella oryzae TaxID=1122943 RepID=UPI0003FE9B37|nr:polysaccharide biosynthesis tyrosine autokinase [Daejeonella oryzae]
MKSELLQENKLANQDIDYKKVLKILWSRWYWIAACILVSLVISYIYLWYTPPIYSTSASIKFDEKKSEISELLKVSNFYDRTNKMQSETFVIQSGPVLLNAISRIDYKISYYIKGRVRSTETYPDIPYPIEIISQDSVNFNRELFEISNADRNTFNLSHSGGAKGNKKKYSYGETISMPGLKFKVKNSSAVTGSLYSFRFNTKYDFIGRATGGLSMREAGKGSNVLILAQTDANPHFAADILNAIIKEYIIFDGSQRSQAASQTIEFIEGQLKFLSDQVKESGTALEQFKKSNRLIDINTNTQLSLGKLTEQESQKSTLKLEALAIQQLEQQIANNSDKVNLNFNLEESGGGLLSGLIAQLNELIVDRDQKLVQYNSNSQPILEIDKQIAVVKSAIINNIKLARERNQRTQRYIDNQIGLAQQGLNSLPSAERDFVNLQSVFDINQKVFSYLSEKKLEAQISKAAVVPGATSVNEAPPGYIIAPVASKIYTNGLMFGLVAGIGIILLIRIINPYIYDKETVESLTNIPIIGIIRRFPNYIDKDNRQILSLEKPKSIFAESVRSVRTNLSYLASEEKSKVICITSEVAGEGKSFVTVNLASTLSLIDKKVVLVAADLRRSKLHKTFNVNNQKGLSNYLSNQLSLEDITIKTDVENLDFIPSGPVPPNPSELLHNEKMKDFIRILKEKYDFVLIDTAPVGLVSDAIPLIRQADINLYVIRSGVSKHSSGTVPDRISREYGLKNVVIVLNAFTDDALYSRYYSTNYATSSQSTYYYYSDYVGYSSSGYYTDDEKKTWWKFWQRFKN